MNDWVMPFSFAVFYSAVYSGNSSLNQYEDVSILIDGIRLNQDNGAPKNSKGTDMANHYIRGRKAISSKKVSAILSLSEEQVIGRILESGLYDRTLGARCLYNLLKSKHLQIDDSVRARMLAFPFRTEPERFLAQMMLHAIRCPQSEVKVLPKETVQDILAFRQEEIPDSGEEFEVVEQKDTRPDKPGFSADEPEPLSITMPPWKLNDDEAVDRMVKRGWTGFATYECMEISYPADRQIFKEQYLAVANCQRAVQLDDDAKRKGADHFRRADATYLINFSGTVEGLADILLHRCANGQCSFVGLAVKMLRDQDYNALQIGISPALDRALAKDGLFLHAYGFDDRLPPGQFTGHLIISLINAQRERSISETVQEKANRNGKTLTPDSERTLYDFFPTRK